MKTIKIIGSTAFLLLFICSSFVMPDDTTSRKYNIIYKGKIIGTVNLFHQKKNHLNYINIHTTASVKKLVTFNISSHDEAMFNNGKLVWSSVYRRVNGKVHENKKTNWDDSVYLLKDETSTKTLSAIITNNMINLYLNEPVNVNNIYSDNHQQFVKMSNPLPHVYMVTLPDGSSNSYEYINNICRKVNISTKFYDVSFELVKN